MEKNSGQSCVGSAVGVERHPGYPGAQQDREAADIREKPRAEDTPEMNAEPIQTAGPLESGLFEKI